MKLDEVVGRMRDAKRFRVASDVKVERLKTPSAMLNRELGGGFAFGRQVLVWGTKSAGKTSFSLQCLAEAQRMGKSVAFIDAEGSFEPDWAEKLGVDTSNMLYDDPKSLNEIDKSMVDLLQAGVDVILLDSITAGVPSALLSDKGEYMGADHNNSIGQKARQTTKVVEGWNLVNKDTLVIIISQTRKTTVGQAMIDSHTNGQAIAFYSSQVLRLLSAKSKNIDAKVNGLTRSIGRQVDWQVVNNKLGPCWGAGTYDFYFEGPVLGVDRLGETVTLAAELGVVDKSGAWWSYNDEKWQGKAAFIEALRADEALQAKLEAEVDGLVGT